MPLPSSRTALARRAITRAVGWAALGGACAEAGAQLSAGAPEAQLAPVQVTGRRDAGSGTLSLESPSQVGSRLGLTLRETPASVSIIDRETLLERGDAWAAGAVGRSVGFAPVGLSAFAGAALAARGFSGNNSVAQLYDGNRMFVSGGALSFPIDTWPFERIEVLSGPASVLYSTGSIGGAVNYVPRTIRRDRAAYELFGSAASWDTYRAGVAGTGPIGPTAAYRLNALASKSNGYVDRDEDDKRVLSGALLFDLSADVALTLMHDQSDHKLKAYYGTPLIDGAIDPRTRRLNYNVLDARTQFQNAWTRARVEWQAAPGVVVRNELYRLSTERDFRNLENYTFNSTSRRVDRSFNFGTDIDQRQSGNRVEIALDSMLAGRRNRFVAGFEINRIHFKTDNVTGGTSSVDPYAFDPGLFVNGAGVQPTLGTRTLQRALFAENAIDVLPGWKLVGGVRNDRIDLTRTDRQTGAQVDYDFKPTTWRVGTVLHVLASTSLYAQYATGNDAAGSLISLPATNAAKLQTGRQVEVGLKQTLLDGRADWTLALYRIEKKNIASRDPFTPNVAQQIGRQSSRGIELAFAARPLPGLSLDANATVLKARFDDFNDLAGTALVSRAGNLPPNTPERLANIFATWRFAAGWETGAGARYVGRRSSNNANTLEIPSYTVADAFVGYRWTPGSVFVLRVRNLFDREWVVGPYNGGNQWALGDPRAVEASVRVSF